MKKYEYKVITIATSLALGTKQYEKIAQEFEMQLNELGADGWELVQRMDGIKKRRLHSFRKHRFHDTFYIHYLFSFPKGTSVAN